MPPATIPRSTSNACFDHGCKPTSFFLWRSSHSFGKRTEGQVHSHPLHSLSTQQSDFKRIHVISDISKVKLSCRASCTSHQVCHMYRNQSRTKKGGLWHCESWLIPSDYQPWRTREDYFTGTSPAYYSFVVTTPMKTYE